MTILTRKFNKDFFLNCHTKTHVSIFMHFQGEMFIFSFKNEALGSESVNKNIIKNENVFNNSYSCTIYFKLCINCLIAALLFRLEVKLSITTF